MHVCACVRSLTKPQPACVLSHMLWTVLPHNQVHVVAPIRVLLSGKFRRLSASRRRCTEHETAPQDWYAFYKVFHLCVGNVRKHKWWECFPGTGMWSHKSELLNRWKSVIQNRPRRITLVFFVHFRTDDKPLKYRSQ